MGTEIYQERPKITGKKYFGQDYFNLSLYCPTISRKAKPGQFVEVKVSSADDPLLRRPLGIHSVKGNSFHILCEIVGRGTELLSGKQPGGYLDIIGPLGNGFNFRHPASGIRHPVIVAGGMGVAPLVFLAEKLKETKNSKSKMPISVLIGARTKKQVLCEKEFKALGCDVKIATDDGSAGFKGRVTDLLKYLLRAAILKPQAIYGCGPKPMLKELAVICKKYRVPAQVSLEAHMSCGFGACLGCAVKTISGFQRVCKEGPVFNAQDIIWQEDAV